MTRAQLTEKILDIKREKGWSWKYICEEIGGMSPTLVVGALLGQIPLSRLGQPGDVAGLATFLASEDADYVTGATYFVDGGLTWNYQEQ